MESFVVSARKYRPGTFEEVQGQEHVTGTLRNALTSSQLGQAFLFCGPRGVGKTTCARILAKAVNCENLTASGDPCNACPSCQSFNEGKSMNIFELDAASNNGVEDIRTLIERLRFIPQEGRRSVYIIDEVHMLSTAAFNAFLKTLEEPPAHALFILATTEKHKILPTILSRCQKFDFRRIEPETVVRTLTNIAGQEGVEYDDEALFLIGVKADGALRDGLSIFDQLVNAADGKITRQLVEESLNVLDVSFFFRIDEQVLDQNHAEALLLLDGIIQQGFDPGTFLQGLLEHLRNLLVAAEGATQALLEASPSQREQYLAMAGRFSPNLLLNAFQLVSEAERQLRSASNTRLVVELCLIKLCHLAQAVDLAEEAAKKKVSPAAG